MLQPRIFQAFIFATFSLFLTTQGRMQYFTTSVLPSIEVYEISRENVEKYPSSPSNFKSLQMKMVNVSRNSDLLFGEATKSDSALALKCKAPYPVQWVYRGDSDPEFNTNTTTTNDGNDPNMYNAFLYMGSRRNLDERETGKYICTSVRNKKHYSYLYIFVTKSALFSSKGLETIQFSKNEDHVRIPCSLSEPRAIATLQKSQDGVLKCPMNDSIRFEPKQGFILSAKRLAQPQGTYLCIADYNNRFQIIKYDLVEGESDNASSGEHEPGETSEFEPTHKPPSQSQTPPHASPPSSTTPLPPSESSECSNQKCGENASCQVNKNGKAVCHCMEGYQGNPYIECKPKQETTTTSSPPHNGDSSGFSCSSYDDCPYDRACYQNICQDPCRVHPICGPHTHCHTQNHTPICECDDGYDGDPYSSQEGQQCEQNHCNPNPCGPNSECNYVNGIISCSCKPGFATQNDAVCRPHLTKEESKRNTSGLSTYPPRRPIPKPLINQTEEIVKKPSGKECHYDIDCSDSEMCVQDRCGDPCVNACGAGALCHTRNHFPRCVCPEGTTGDPFYKCTPLFSEVLGSTTGATTNVSLPSSTIKPESSSSNEIYDVNCGGQNSPCGPNTICQATRNHYVCACPNNFLGDPYSKRGCFAERGYSKCQRDEDCFHFLTCLRNRGCVNPCNVMHVCKPGRSCVPHLHKPACLKTNLDGDALRDGLISYDEKSEIGNLELTETIKNSTCFVKNGDKIVSPCGRNSICYDPNTNMVGISETMPACGCMPGMVGDPYVSCEPLQSCKNNSSCGANETCTDGFCKPNEVPGQVKTLNVHPFNPCSPSPCPNPEEQCVIIRGKNNAICLSPGQSVKDGSIVTARAPLSNRFRSRSGCHAGLNCETEGEEDDEAEDDIEGSATTEWATDITLIPPTTTISASYISSLGSASSSIEETEPVISPRYFMTSFNFSNENTLSVIDV